MTKRLAINWTSEEALLIRSLLRDPAHQKAMEMIWRKACGVGENAFVLGEDGRRETDFNLGRLAVAQAIIPLTHPEVGKRIRQKKSTEAKEANND